MNNLLRKIFFVASCALLCATSAFGQLSGTYTIDPNGSGATNYTSFTAAIAALSANGVNGPVIFNVSAGTFTEQIVVPAVTGASKTNTITFQSNPANSAAVVLTTGAATSTANYVIRMNAAKYVTFDGIDVSNTTSSYGACVQIFGANRTIKFTNGEFSNAYTGTSSTSAFFTKSTASTNRFDTLEVSNCILGSSTNAPYYATYFYGSSTSPTASSSELIFKNNTVYFRFYGVYTSYIPSGEIAGNTVIQSGTTTTSGYGIRTYQSSTSAWSGASDWIIASNKVTLISGGYGIYTFYSNSSSASHDKIYNNYVENLGGVSGMYGIYASYSTNLDIANNTVRTRST